LIRLRGRGPHSPRWKGKVPLRQWEQEFRLGEPREKGRKQLRNVKFRKRWAFGRSGGGSGEVGA